MLCGYCKIRSCTVAVNDKLWYEQPLIVNRANSPKLYNPYPMGDPPARTLFLQPIIDITLPKPDESTQLYVRNKPRVSPLVQGGLLDPENLGHLVYGQEFIHIRTWLKAISTP